MSTRIYVAHNDSWKFSSVYSKITGLRVLIRAILIFLYLMLTKALSKLKKNILVETLLIGVRILLIMDCANSLSSLIFLATSISSAKIVFLPLEVILIVLDMLMITGVNYTIWKGVRKYKGKATKDIKCAADRSLVTYSCYQQRGTKL